MQCDLGDVALYYEVQGAGRPIVMLPGRPSDHQVMARFMEPLFAQRDGWMRLYPDLPGTGRTPAVDRLATHDAMLDAMLAFIDAVISSQRFVLAGLSYGGYLARGVVHRRVASIDGLLLCAPQVKTDAEHPQLPPQTTVVADPTLVDDLGPGASLVVAQTPPVVAAVRELFAEVAIADQPFNERLGVAGPFSFNVDALPAPFGAPTLILTGHQDQLCGYRDALELLEKYPRATFAVLDRAGHFVNIEQDSLCRALIAEWLNRVEEYVPA
jgi:pimeloyl-ACP methyl ester carboxylesterase